MLGFRGRWQHFGFDLPQFGGPFGEGAMVSGSTFPNIALEWGRWKQQGLQVWSETGLWRACPPPDRGRGRVPDGDKFLHSKDAGNVGRGRSERSERSSARGRIYDPGYSQLTLRE